jgi:ribosome-binding factor A
MQKTSPSGPSQRQLRVGEQVRHALAEVLQRGEVMDPVLDSLTITVPEVRLTPDLKIATVYIMPLGGERGEEAVKALARNVKPIRQALARRMREMKYLPDLRFRVDDRFDEALRIETLLHDPHVARDLAKPDGSGE